MRYPACSGDVAHALGVSEPQLQSLVRRGKIKSPPIHAGRRLWARGHVLAAARRLGVTVENLLQEVEGVR